MKKIALVHTDGTVLFEGRPLEMPFKKEAVIAKSVELFDDDDPCIIHRSQVARHFADVVEGRFKSEGKDVLLLEDHPDIQSFLDIDENTGVTIRKTG